MGAGIATVIGVTLAAAYSTREACDEGGSRGRDAYGVEGRCTPRHGLLTLRCVPDTYA